MRAQTRPPARRAHLPAARQGLRPDAGGGRRRCGRGRRRPLRLHPRRREPAPRRAGPARSGRRPAGHGARGRSRRRRHRSRPALPGRRRARCVAGTPCSCAEASRSRQSSTFRGSRPDDTHLDRARTTSGRVVLAGGLGPENVREAIDAVQPVGGRRQLEPRGRAGRQGPRARPRIRRGGTMTSGVYGELRRAVRAGDADPGARRARSRLGGGTGGPVVRRPSSTGSGASTRADRRRSRSRSASLRASGST